MAEPVTVAEPFTIAELVTVAEPVTVIEPVTVFDALEHMLGRVRCTRPLSSSPQRDEDDGHN